MRNRDFTIVLGSHEVDVHDVHGESGWRVTLADTGKNTMTGGRIKRMRKCVGDSTFMVTYGDGVANIDLAGLLACHEKQGRLATVTAVRPSSRYGELAIRDSKVVLFREKPQVTEGWINGGVFVFTPSVLYSIEGATGGLTTALLCRLSDRGALARYHRHSLWA